MLGSKGGLVHPTPRQVFHMKRVPTTWRERVRSAALLALLSIIAISGVLLVAYGGSPVRPF